VWRIVDGRPPAAADELALDQPTARDQGFVVGDAVKVNSEGGSRTFELVGIAQYDELSSPANATWALFDAVTASEFVAKEGFIDAVLVRGDGMLSDDELADRIEGQLDPRRSRRPSPAWRSPSRRRRRSRRRSRSSRSFSRCSASSRLASGCFVIYNVFSISAAQRRRENALLRAVGASRRQVTRMMLVEALVVGLVGSLLGLVGGVGLAIGIRSILDALGFGIPARGLALETGTITITMIAGVVTTLIAAVVPAIAAGRVAPVAAMSEVAFERPQRNRLRTAIAALFVMIGIAAIAAVVAGADGTLLGIASSRSSSVCSARPRHGEPDRDRPRRARCNASAASPARWRAATSSATRSAPRAPAAPVLIGVALVTGATVSRPRSRRSSARRSAACSSASTSSTPRTAVR
jgi:putative ABC transport system permease protein